jgi:polyketide cyclase/dehydrase/lipid transport protein
VLTYEARTSAAAEAVWPLIAEPARWSAWAPHLRGAWGLGDPEVRPGAIGAVRLLGVVPVPARITAKDPGRSWDWHVGPASLRHRVAPDGDGAIVGVDILAPGPLEPVLGATYGPLVAALVRNLARVAERQARRRP